MQLTFIVCRVRLLEPTLSLPLNLSRLFFTTSQQWTTLPEQDHSFQLSKEVKQRTAELEQSRPGANVYPRWALHDTLIDYASVNEGASTQTSVKKPSLSSIRKNQIIADQSLDAKQNQPDAQIYQIAGRIVAIRTAGKYLAFIDVQANGKTFQVKLNHGKLPNVTLEAFQDLVRLFRRGDHISAKGSATTTKAGLSALQAVELPVLRAPCLQRLPVPRPLAERDLDREATVDRHVEMLTYPGLIDTLKVRSYLMNSIRSTLSNDGFLEVQTPILGGEAGGATARPFVTTASEFSDRRLSLRIAPELWLKRLVIGGLTQVFEIGPSFRNEGLDKVHNPEFTTCEFYAAYVDIARLRHYTERILADIAEKIETLATPSSFDQAVISEWKITETQSYPKIDFIPAVNAALGVHLPNLASASAREEILAIFARQSIPVPPTPTLPRLIDTLCAHFIEPQCQQPTWIINTPECLSPLAKSFIHPTAPNDQPVAARAELFIRGKEVVNCYEEENSPAEQRRKFVNQQRYARLAGGAGRVDDEAMQVDEDYIRALEWGLPPTGGWGCGIDRLVMLATGMERIGDVLSFGNLRAVTRAAGKVGK
jgi:lysyl-tRNA synthetase, class II